MTKKKGRVGFSPLEDKQFIHFPHSGLAAAAEISLPNGYLPSKQKKISLEKKTIVTNYKLFYPSRQEGRGALVEQILERDIINLAL